MISCNELDELKFHQCILLQILSRVGGLRERVIHAIRERYFLNPWNFSFLAKSVRSNVMLLFRNVIGAVTTIFLALSIEQCGEKEKGQKQKGKNLIVLMFLYYL
jgi:hypothetical protein